MSDTELAPQSDELGTNRDLVGKFLENQSRELEIRAEENALRAQQDKNSFEFSCKALEVRAADRREERNHQRYLRYAALGVGVLATLIVAILLGVCLYKDKDEIAMEIVKGSVFVGAGFLGGWGTAQLRKPEPSKRPDPSTGSGT